MIRNGRRVAMLLVTLCVAVVACDRRSATTGATPAAERSAVWREAIASAGQQYQVVHVDLSRAKLTLRWKQPGLDTPFQTFEALEHDLRAQGQSLVFATNAGIFDATHTPVGLHIEAGRVLHSINLSDGDGNFFLKPNGVFLIGRDGTPTIIESASYERMSTSAVYATQSGPLLVAGEKLHPAIRENSPNRQIRSVVGIQADRSVVFVLSASPVTFYEISTACRDELWCGDVLYLDGFVSKFYSPTLEYGESQGNFGAMFAVSTSLATVTTQP